jgi:hypothetical protein
MASSAGGSNRAQRSSVSGVQNGTLRLASGGVDNADLLPVHAPPPLLAAGQGGSAESIFPTALVAVLCLALLCILVPKCVATLGLLSPPESSPAVETNGELSCLGANGHCYAKVDHARLNQWKF